MSRLVLNEVFPTVGKPTVTYIERDDGAPERKLTASLQTPGQICMLTGPSKLGKTSLYQQVVPTLKREPLVIRCSGKLDHRNFWATALERLDFSRLAERGNAWGLRTEASIGTSGESGWKWLSTIMPTLNLKLGADGNISNKRHFAQAELSASHLIPLLKEMPLQLIVEDFHYLDVEVKREIFQQWKSFVDEGISVLVFSTAHHSNELFSANADLSGRTRVLDLGQWRSDDLAKIVKVGFDYLGIKNGEAIRQYVATESVGVPIITQQICFDFASRLDLSRSSNDVRKNYHPTHIKENVRNVAKEFYSGFERDYERLVEGPRSRARKHDTYGMILSAFVMDPIKFSLSKSELVERINQLSTKEAIPIASINSALKALSSHQKRMAKTLLEWQPTREMLHIIEPTFVYYLRQRVQENHEAGDEQGDLLHSLFDKMAQVPYIRESVIPRHAGPRITQTGPRGPYPVKR
ncbi:hypothetical protein [Sphingomonas sp. M1-B02]|uniref:hypothetical protein n=1 Tax=Sphingomonas sp. M1-B02 TaxID=3114300 RepID=UPI00223E998B|nr:hypothetical protein [Sphingomonas sp. S6-11]UZK64821.1 hypothetical protein OKW87_09770 [Sphingomonas sp. S6-11]